MNNSNIVSALVKAFSLDSCNTRTQSKDIINKALLAQALFIQAPMAVVQDHKLAIAVTKAGGLGSIPCATLSIDQILENIDACKKAGIDNVNLNFFCHQPPDINDDAMQQWANELQPHFTELGIEQKYSHAVSRTPIDQEVINALSSIKPPIFSFHFGLPAPELLAQLKAWGAIILASATSITEGIWLQENGADIIIAQGVEAGGHRGMFLETDITLQQTTFSLLPKLVKRLSVPIIAAGGISDEHDVRAAMNLGASGVQVGTSYLLCDEVNTSDLYRTALKSPQAKYTCLTNVFTGRPARGIVNKAVKKLGPMSNTVPEFPLAATSMSQLKKAAEKKDSSDYSPLWSGQNNTGCKEISATILTEELILGFKD